MELFRVAVKCNECFKGELQRSFIDVAQPRFIGQNYWTCDRKILVLMINPGQGSDDDAHRRGAALIRAFGDGSDNLGEIFQMQRGDLQNWGKFMHFYCDRLHLCVDDLALANVAWCSTKGNKYPGWMLDNCFNRHTAKLVLLLNPDVILLSGQNLQRFEPKLRRLLPKARIIPCPHFAHREGGKYEDKEVQRILGELGESTSSTATIRADHHPNGAGDVLMPERNNKVTGVDRTPPPDFPQDFYARKMYRQCPEFAFRPGKRNKIWGSWADGCEVGKFTAQARATGDGGIEDVRIYIAKDLVRFDPPLTRDERARIRSPRG